MDKNEVKWCAQISDCDERIEGPFDTREAAIQGAREEIEERGLSYPHEVSIGLCDFAYPDFDIETFLEIIEQNARDNGFSWVDDTVFSFKTSSSACLSQAIHDQLTKHLTSVYFTMNEVTQSHVTLEEDVAELRERLDAAEAEVTALEAATSHLFRVGCVYKAKNPDGQEYKVKIMIKPANGDALVKRWQKHRPAKVSSYGDSLTLEITEVAAGWGDEETVYISELLAGASCVSLSHLEGLTPI